MAGLTKYQGFNGGMYELLDQIDRQFSRSFSQDLRKMFDGIMKSEKSFFKYVERGSYPKCREVYTDTHLIFEFTVPGFSQEDVNVDISNGYITVTVPKFENDIFGEKSNIIIDEIPSGRESRSIPLPVDELELDESKIEASVKNGRLLVKIPRKVVQKEEQKKLTIKVR